MIYRRIGCVPALVTPSVSAGQHGACILFHRRSGRAVKQQAADHLRGAIELAFTPQQLRARHANFQRIAHRADRCADLKRLCKWRRASGRSFSPK